VPKLGYLHETFASLPTECEVLVQVMASSVNPCDRGTDAARNPKVLGSDISGTVVEVGTGCTRLKVGDAVWADIGAVVYLKNHLKTKELGAYAEYALAVESQLGIMPPNLGFEEAGSLPKVALTSFKALVWYAGGEVGGINNSWMAGKTVLVLGGSGGTGTTGIQLAKALGAAKVLTTAGASNAAYCVSLGADEVYDYHTQNWWDDAVVPDDSVDVVYDCVGQTGSGDRAMTKLREGGYYVTIAGGEGRKPRAGRHQAGFINSATNLDNVPLLDRLANFRRADKLRMPHLDVFSLAQSAQAFAHMDVPDRVGKTVISVRNATVL
jgi:NADPH:quinone reductase-like Zn-dependent oxidoreductase